MVIFLDYFSWFQHNREISYKTAFSSDHPSVSIWKPKRYLWFAGAYTLASSSTFLERLRSNIESSMINTFARSFESKGMTASLMIWEAGRVEKRIQLLWDIFVNRYKVFLANLGVFRPVIKFIYILLLENTSRKRYWNISLTGITFFL